MALTLLEKLQGVMHGDDALAAMMEPCEHYPQPDVCGKRPLTGFEGDLRLWGMLYGVAFGLARAEEPCEPAESVSRRAFNAAKIAFEDFNGGPLRSPSSDAADCERKAA